METQPIEVDPNPVTKQPSSHPNGSFGAVFIVLAVIVVVSAAACFLGRLCSRRRHQKQPKSKNNNQGHRNKEAEHGGGRRKQGFEIKGGGGGGGGGGDIEIGFEMMKKMPSAKMGAKENHHYYPKMVKPGFRNGEYRVGDDGGFRGVGGGGGGGFQM